MKKPPVVRHCCTSFTEKMLQLGKLKRFYERFPEQVSFPPLYYPALSSMPTHSPLDIIYVQPGTHLKRTTNLDIGFLRRSDVVALWTLLCLSGKGCVRPPFRGCTWVRFFQHLVDLF